MLKLQTAIEFLLTYSWAFIILAAVLIILVYLNVFNPLFNVPRLPPGYCYVSRPLGPGYNEGVSLLGDCFSRDLPEYVFTSRGPGDYIRVNGSDNYTSLANIQGDQLTITAWVYVNGWPYHDIVDKEGQYGMKLDYNDTYLGFCKHPNTFCLEFDDYGDWIGENFTIPGMTFHQWNFLAVVLNGSNKYFYANGKLIGHTDTGQPIQYVDSNLTIGACSTYSCYQNQAEWFNGSIADVQIYDVALSSSDIAALYNEGIAGAPIDLAGIVAWYPLDGNPYDYSGDGLNGSVVNSSFAYSSFSTSYQPLT
ncbi:MAG: hypothetical protein ARM1_0721 [Candidatus Micrarchaeota archaeon]|nr:MAG: hypothetical protein ARM1_0721 [Candidatus Micrarchaeota archaeon]